MYVYIQSEPGLWTVGFYKPDGSWAAESDHESGEEAAGRVAYLNGSRPGAEAPDGLRLALLGLCEEIRRLKNAIIVAAARR